MVVIGFRAAAVSSDPPVAEALPRLIHVREPEERKALRPSSGKRTGRMFQPKGRLMDQDYDDWRKRNDDWRKSNVGLAYGTMALLWLGFLILAYFFLFGGVVDDMDRYAELWNQAGWYKFANLYQRVIYEVMYFGAIVLRCVAVILAILLTLLVRDQWRSQKPPKANRWAVLLAACFAVLWLVGRIFVGSELKALKAAVADRRARELELAAQIAMNRGAPQNAQSPEEAQVQALRDEAKKQAFLRNCSWKDFPDKDQYPWLADVQKAELERDANWRGRLQAMEREHRDLEFKFTTNCLGSDLFFARDLWRAFSPNLQHKLMRADCGQANEFVQRVEGEYRRKSFPAPDPKSADRDFDMVKEIDDIRTGAKPPAGKSVLKSGQADRRLDGSPEAKKWFAGLERKWEGFLKGEAIEDTAEIELAEKRSGFAYEVQRLLPYSPYLEEEREFPESLRTKLADGEWDIALMFLKSIESEYRNKGYDSEGPAPDYGPARSGSERKALEKRKLTWKQEKKKWFADLEARWEEYAEQSFEFNYKTLRAFDQIGVDAKTSGERFREQIRIIARESGREFDEAYLERDERVILGQPPVKEEPPENDDAAAPRGENGPQPGTAKSVGRKKMKPSDAELRRMMLKIRNPGTEGKAEREFLQKLNARDQYQYSFDGPQLVHTWKPGYNPTSDELNSIDGDDSFDPLPYNEQMGRFMSEEAAKKAEKKAGQEQKRTLLPPAPPPR